MTDLSNLISAAVTAKMTPEFIEKEVDSRVEKLIVESVDRALRSYSDTGKLIEKAVEDALRVNHLDLPAYGEIVADMLKAQIELRVAPLVSERLAADMNELLSLAPKEVKLSEIAAIMLKEFEHDGQSYGEVITVIVEDREGRSTWVYLDDKEHHDHRDKYKCRHRMLISEDGSIFCAYTDDKDARAGKWIGRSFGFDQMLRAYVACGTKITIDEDAVVTSVGDY